jgi:hypothetical protein
MSYVPATDFLALLRQTATGTEIERMPGLDYVVAALARAGMFQVWTGLTAPAANQQTTVWVQPAQPSWTAECTVWLWNSELSEYQLATPNLWSVLLAFEGPGQAYDPPYGGSVPTTVDKKLQEWVSFLDFGAVADGATNNDKAWISFINALISTGRAGYIPGGAASYIVATAAVSVSPTKPFHIFGDGTIERTTEVYAPLLEVIGGQSPLIEGVTLKYSGPNPQRNVTNVTVNGAVSVTYAYSGAALSIGESVTVFGVLGMGNGDANGNITSNITAVGANTFTVAVDGSSWTAYGSGGIIFNSNAGNHQSARLIGSTNGTFRGVSQLGRWYAGLELRNPAGGSIEDCFSQGSVNRGLYVQGNVSDDRISVTGNEIDGEGVTTYGINTNIATGDTEVDLLIFGNRVFNVQSQGIAASGAIGAVIAVNTIDTVTAVGGIAILNQIVNADAPQFVVINGNTILNAQIGIAGNDDLRTIISNNGISATIPAAAVTAQTCFALMVEGSQLGNVTGNILSGTANAPNGAVGAFFGAGTNGDAADNNVGSGNEITLAGTGTLIGILTSGASADNVWLFTTIQGAGTNVSDAGTNNNFSVGVTGTGPVVLANNPTLGTITGNFNITGEYRIDGNPILDVQGNYVELFSIDGINVGALGNAADPTNYWNNTTHEFRSRDGLTLFGTITATATAVLGSLLSMSPSGGVGYEVGAGGVVVQATNKATAVVLNTVSGQITMSNAALAGGAVVFFTLMNSAIAGADTVSVNLQTGNATPATYRVHVEAITGGSCIIVVTNISGGSLGEALVLNFNVMKGAHS